MSTRYAEYIRSARWRECKKEALHFYQHRCILCNADRSAGLDVHHRTYDRLGNEWLTDLVVLCRVCHETFHRTGAAPEVPKDETDPELLAVKSRRHTELAELKEKIEALPDDSPEAPKLAQRFLELSRVGDGECRITK